MPHTVEHRGAGRDPLHAIVADGFVHLQQRLAAEDRHLPAFVTTEIAAYLACGDVAAGFGWLECTGCRHQRLVAFSCKKRGFCPTCGARRMTERAAAWVDGLFPFRRVRQWVPAMSRQLSAVSGQLYANGAVGHRSPRPRPLASVESQDPPG